MKSWHLVTLAVLIGDLSCSQLNVDIPPDVGAGLPGTDGPVVPSDPGSAVHDGAATQVDPTTAGNGGAGAPGAGGTAGSATPGAGGSPGAGTGGSGGAATGMGGAAGSGGAAGPGGPRPVCTQGMTRCASGLASTVEECRDGTAWSTKEMCPFDCLGGSCTECKIGDSRCAANDTPQMCGTDGKWASGPACEFVCMGKGVCGSCKPGTRRCSGQSVQTCNPDGSGWSDTESCQFGCDGSKNACRACSLKEGQSCPAGDCQTGTLDCKEACVKKNKPDGAGCGNGGMCKGGACRTCGAAGLPCCNGTDCNSNDLFCDGSTCRARKRFAAGCTKDAECPVNGHCVFGVCCNQAVPAGSGGQGDRPGDGSRGCKACEVCSKTDGQCTAAPFGASEPVCASNEECDGKGTCLSKPGESCAADEFCSTHKCDPVLFVCLPK